MYKEIGAFDAKAKFSELLREVSAGQRYTISVRGKPVADLVPSRLSQQHDAKVALEELQQLELIKGVSDEEIHDWIRQGRE